jgi:YVTN family beta-propeller protein
MLNGSGSVPRSPLLNPIESGALIDFRPTCAYTYATVYGGLRSMNLTTVKKYCGGPRHVWLLLGMLLIALPLSARTVRIYIANHAGDNIDVIDPVTNKIVQEIQGIEIPHGVDFSPDGSRVYVSDEAENTLDVVDQKSGKITKRIPLSGHPNNLAVTKDGKRVFVCIAEKPGALDVIDTASLERVKSIPMKGPLHNVYVTPDGKYAVMGSKEAKLLIVVDVRTEQPVWEVKFNEAVRNMAFERNPDGSTRRVFVTTSHLHGFAVVDFAERKVVAEIKLPDEPSGGKARFEPDVQRVPVHGIGVTPDNKTFWVNSKFADAVFVYSLPDLKLLGHALTGVEPDWITFSPDSKMVYDCNPSENTVSVIDAQTLKEVARIPVGQSPKRNSTLVLP